MTPSTSRILLFGAAATLALAAATTPTPARASIYMSTNGGGACHAAASGPTSFKFTNTSVENTGTTDQYVICGFADFTISGDQSALPIDTLKVYLGSGAYAGTATCVAQMGTWYSGVLHIVSSRSQNKVMTANDIGALIWLSEDLPRTHEYETLLLNCKLPRGFKLGLIQRVEQEPASGNGWTP
jgi:hypothetical protein